MEGNPLSAKNSRGEDPKHEYLLISTAEMEKETGKAPWVDVKDVLLRFTGVGCVKVSVQ